MTAWGVSLANDVAEEMEVFAALVSWQGRTRPVPVFASGDEPLLGNGSALGQPAYRGSLGWRRCDY